MAEYFGYVERDKPIAVDWSKVTQQITTKLDEAEQKKATETAAALKGSKNIADDIKNLKASNRTSGRNFVGNVGYLLGDVNEQLKLAAQTGQIGAKDLVLQQDALKGQLELFNVWSSDYAKRYAGYEALTNPSPVSQASAALMQSYDFVGDLEPTWEDGQLKFYKYDPNSPTGARIGGNQAKPLSITDLNALTYHNKESVDFNERLKDVTTSLKQKLPSTTTSAGGIVTTVDPRQNPNFEPTLRKSAEAEFNSVGSIKAANYLVQTGLNTEVSFDPYDAAKAGAGTIFLEIDPVTNQPVVVSQQKNAIQQKARDEFYKSIDASFGVKTTSKTPPKPSGNLTTIQKSSKKTLDLLNQLVGSSDKKSAVTAANALVSQNKNILDIDYIEDPNNPNEIKGYKITTPTGVQTIDVADTSGTTKSMRDEKDVIQDLYNYSDAVGQQGKSGVAFDDAWKISGLTSQGTSYQPTRARSFSPAAENYSQDPGFLFKNKNKQTSTIPVTSDLDYWSKDNTNVPGLGFSGANKFDANMEDYWTLVSDGAGVPSFAAGTLSVSKNPQKPELTVVAVTNKRMPIEFVVPKLTDAKSNADLTSALREAMFLLKDQNPDLKGKDEYNDYYYEQVKRILNTTNPNAFQEWAILNANLDKP